MWLTKVLFLDKVLPHTPHVKELEEWDNASPSGGCVPDDGTALLSSVAASSEASAVLEATGPTSDDAVTASGAATSAVEASAATDVELADAVKG